MPKTHAIFDALWFNAVASIIAVSMLLYQIWRLVMEGVTVEPIVYLIIWFVISFHFVQKIYRKKGNE